MKTIQNYVNQLQNTNSKKEKEIILKEALNVNSFKEVIIFLLDNSTTTGIAPKKLSKVVLSHANNSRILSMHELLMYLKTHSSGTNDDISVVQQVIQDNLEYKDLISKIVTKTLRLGIDSKTVNKVYPDLIPTFNVMLGSSFESAKLKGTEYITISVKENGTRCIIIDGVPYSRQGKKFKNLDHIINDIKQIPNYKNFVFDGELLLLDNQGLNNSEAFQKSNGIVMSDVIYKTDLKFTCFDLIYIDDFKGVNEYSSTYNNRIEFLYKKLRNNDGSVYTTQKYKYIDTLTLLYEGKDHSKINECLQWAEDNDLEGVMVALDKPYECKRTKNLLKVKAFKDCDIKCIDMECGTGRNQDVLGAIICDYKGNTVKVGSGFTDEQRQLYWKNKDLILDKIVNVKYKEETKNKKNGLFSIQFPVFQHIRDDKILESYN